MEGRGNLEFVALFPVPGSRRSHGRVRHIAHIPKCQFRTPVSEALTMNNFFLAAEARTSSRPVRFPGVGWIPAGQEWNVYDEMYCSHSVLDVGIAPSRNSGNHEQQKHCGCGKK